MFRTIILLSVAGAALANAGFDCAKYQTECVDTGKTDAYVDSCEAIADANTDESMKCRIEHLGYITAGDDATRDQHCSHAAEVADGPCKDETLKEWKPDTPGWCSWIQCTDTYATRSTHKDATWCHAEKGNCEGDCAQGEGAGAKWCTESNAATGCPSMCATTEAQQCGDCTPCLTNPDGTTTSGKACSTCDSCSEYAVCASCESGDNNALFEAAGAAAVLAMGLDVAQMTAFGTLLEGITEDSPIGKLLATAVAGAFSNGTPTLEALTATMKTTFTSAEFSTLLESTDGVDAELLAAVNTAVDESELGDGSGSEDGPNAESGAAGLALNLAVVAMAAAALL